MQGLRVRQNYHGPQDQLLQIFLSDLQDRVYEFLKLIHRPEHCLLVC
jgi:hypothetical protein